MNFNLIQIYSSQIHIKKNMESMIHSKIIYIELFFKNYLDWKTTYNI
jgi:hypothetical protein